MGEVYVITNNRNGMKYVGQTLKSGKHRLYQSIHMAKSRQSTKLLRAIREFGGSAFTVDVLERSDDREVLLAREAYWIEELGTVYPGGYNSKPADAIRSDIAGLELQRLREKYPEVAAEVARRHKEYLGRFTPDQAKRWDEFEARYYDPKVDITHFRQVSREMRKHP